MADAINHDGASTVATVGSKAVQYGLLGAALAAAAGFGLAVVAAGIVTSIAQVGFGVGASAMLSGGAATWIIGMPAAAVTGWFGGGYAAVGGGLLGVLKGTDQVSRESNAFRRRVEANMAKGQNKEAKLFNDGEIKGIDEGYAMAVQDLQPQMQAAFQKGQESVVQQIQAQMMQAAAEQQAAPAQPKEGKFADKFECKAACHAEAEIVKREEKAAQPNQLG